MSDARPEVVFVLPDKLGGVFSYVENMLANRHHDGLRYAAVLTDNTVNADTRTREPLIADRCVGVRYSLPPENLYAVLRRLAAAVGTNPGALVANDWIELALASVHDTGRAVIAVNHGDFDYYYDLAVRHEPVIDAFVTYTTRMRDHLRVRLPAREDSIHLLRYGVRIPPAARTPVPGPLRLLYVGRLSRDKGVFDLPEIDAVLRERGVKASWTVQGAGPDEAALRACWPDGSVQWTGHQPMQRVLDLYLSHDVLVMPSRNEGLPVALLEAAAAGVVPVVSDLPSGIPEVVEPGVTGFRPAPGDIRAFADAVERLATDRLLVESISRAIRDRVSLQYEVRACTSAYQALFAQWRELKRPRAQDVQLPYGSRLDRPWIPNAIVKALRSSRVNHQGRFRPAGR
jgi:glycosyltransferase involved in cell wall biosynthesis